LKTFTIPYFVLICLSLLFSGGASAATYFGGGLGRASWDLKPFGNVNLEDDIAIRLFGGVRVDYIGGEIELAFSSHDWEGSGGQITHNAVHIIFSGVGYLPIVYNLDLYGKLGINMWGTSVDIQNDIYEGDNGIDLALGLGLNFHVAENFLIRLEYQSLPGLSDGFDKGDITQYTANFAFSY